MGRTRGHQQSLYFSAVSSGTQTPETPEGRSHVGFPVFDWGLCVGKGPFPHPDFPVNVKDRERKKDREREGGRERYFKELAHGVVGPGQP